MTEYCAVCGLHHNAYMTCASARRLRDAPSVAEYQRRMRDLAEERKQAKGR